MKSVLITRTVELATPLAHEMRALSFEPIIFPTIEITSLAFDTTINLNAFKFIIFISPAAIHNFSAHIKTLPAHLKIFTMGEDSAALIRALGWPTAIYPPIEFNREGLLHLPELNHLADMPILLVEGNPSNHLLATALRSRGANVTQCFVYERTLPQPTAYPDIDTIDIIVVTSEQSLKNLVELLGSAVKSKRLLLSSARLGNIAKNLGFSQKPLFAQNAGNRAILEALKTVA